MLLRGGGPPGSHPCPSWAARASRTGRPSASGSQSSGASPRLHGLKRGRFATMLLRPSAREQSELVGTRLAGFLNVDTKFRGSWASGERQVRSWRRQQHPVRAAVLPRRPLAPELLCSPLPLQVPDQCPHRAGRPLQRHLAPGEPPLRRGLPDPGPARVQHLL